MTGGVDYRTFRVFCTFDLPIESVDKFDSFWIILKNGGEDNKIPL